MGRAEGVSEVLLSLLTFKFGTLAAPERTRVENASIEQLLIWTERAFTANSLPDVLR